MTEGGDLAKAAGVVRTAALTRLREIAERKTRYDLDLEAFSGDCLTIRPKEGGESLLRFNDDQRTVHEACEDQKRRTGKVRKLILKARKTGVSTYVEARFYKDTSRNHGRRAFILTNSDDATDVIFDMADLFHQNNPYAPVTGKSNAKELSFSELNSSIAVGTAGAKVVARGDTIQLFHGSEVSFWPNAEAHATGALEAVPDVPGTEIILESTANGATGLFYSKCMAALRKQGEYELIFLPWYTHKAYATPAPAEWRPPAKFVEYAYLHKLNRPQLYWAFRKNAELAAIDNMPEDEICWRFRQEYPATVEEAFRAGRAGSFISAEAVLKARKFLVGPQSHAPIVLGCDFACGGDGEGGDENVIIDRQGRRAGGHVFDRIKDKNTIVVSSRLAHHIDRVKPAMCFLDTGGGGAQVYDILVARGYGAVLTLVNFAATPRDERKYVNKRAEMWGEGRDWLADPGGAQIPDDDLLDKELTVARAKDRVMDTRILLQPKHDIRKLHKLSPDGADALFLTFAEPVRKQKKSVGVPSFGGGDPTVGY